MDVAEEYNSDDEMMADNGDEHHHEPEESPAEYARVSAEEVAIEDQFASFGVVDGADYVKLLGRLQRAERERLKKLNAPPPTPGALQVGAEVKVRYNGRGKYEHATVIETDGNMCKVTTLAPTQTTTPTSHTRPNTLNPY